MQRTDKNLAQVEMDSIIADAVSPTVLDAARFVQGFNLEGCSELLVSIDILNATTSPQNHKQVCTALQQ